MDAAPLLPDAGADSGPRAPDAFVIAPPDAYLRRRDGGPTAYLDASLPTCTWERMLLEERGDVGRESVVRVDDALGLHFALYRREESLMIGEWPVGGTYSTRNVPDAMPGLGFAGELDADGGFHVLLRDCNGSGGCGLEAAMAVGSDWTVVPIDYGPMVLAGSFTKTVLADSTLFASYVAFKRTGESYVRMATGDIASHAWAHEDVVIERALDTAIGRANNGVLYVAHTRAVPDEALSVATRTGSGVWRDEVIDLEWAGGLSIAAGAEGDVHLAYVVYTPCEVRYAHLVGGFWEVERVRSIPGTEGPCPALDTRIVLDDAGRIHIAYLEDTVGYALRVPGADWHHETIDAEVDHDDSAISLAVDAVGGVYVTYSALNYVLVPPSLVAEPDHDFWYAHRVPCGD
jgi:hypothetical protein